MSIDPDAAHWGFLDDETMIAGEPPAWLSLLDDHRVTDDPDDPPLHHPQLYPPSVIGWMPVWQWNVRTSAAAVLALFNELAPAVPHPPYVVMIQEPPSSGNKGLQIVG